ncbi:hypothetical protein DSO57_1011316 [Entomophthora muscae]|uniref:Uncharacterized protein n=1 Tax=Entomophthora muscae TaxID=34485 RepID=A0ACC2T6P9_9FUNG|nr:hypothetical protein DSO57_1011316 [Entomophthora muscae]
MWKLLLPGKRFLQVCWRKPGQAWRSPRLSGPTQSPEWGLNPRARPPRKRKGSQESPLGDLNPSHPPERARAASNCTDVLIDNLAATGAAVNTTNKLVVNSTSIELQYSEILAVNDQEKIKTKNTDQLSISQQNFPAQTRSPKFQPTLPKPLPTTFQMPVPKSWDPKSPQRLSSRTFQGFQFIHHLSRSQIQRLEYHPRPTPMDYQPGPDPGMAGIPYDSPAPPISQPYDQSRAGMVILSILSLAEVVIPNLGAYHPLAVGLLYLTCSAPLLYWALVTRYPDELSSPSMPWYMTAPGHDKDCA